MSFDGGQEGDRYCTVVSKKKAVFDGVKPEVTSVPNADSHKGNDPIVFLVQ
jgi:hypothetical protein